MAKKIRSLMDKLDIVKDASNELYRGSNQTYFSKKLRFLEPYQLQQRSEYVNQAPVMIATMLNTKVGEKTLWDAYDEDGNWKTEEFGAMPENFQKEFKVKVDQIIKKLHGNYDSEGSPIKLKSRILGRMLVQFRTWMLEGFRSRVEREKPDIALGYTRKGRYRTGWETVLGTAKGKNAEELSGIENVLFTLNQLARKLTLRGTKFDERFNEVDAANMRANLQELMIYLGIMGTIIMLKGGLDEEENKNKRMAYNYLVNQLLRLQTDIVFYMNPIEFEKLTKYSIPAFKIVSDTSDWVDAVYRAVFEEDEIKSGMYKGSSRLTRETSQMLPFGTQIYRQISASSQLFEN